MMCIISKTIYLSSVFSLVYPMASFASFNPAYASLVDTSQNQTFESKPAYPIKLAAVHFITNDNALNFGNQEFLPGDLCKQGGYSHESCPSGYIKGEACPYDSKFVKDCIDPDTWCKNNGYTVTSCSVPKYLATVCSYKGTLYKSCETDNIRACKELGYTLSCETGKIGDSAQTCPYNSSYKKCICNPCSGYAYTAAQASAQGYVPGEVCNSCGTIKYKRSENACSGYKTCDCGGETGAKICYSGSVQKFNACKTCCDSKYQYDSSNCTGGKVLAGNSCGGKYESCTSPCGTQYVYDESNCPSSQNFHCSASCGGKYSDCLLARFTGTSTSKYNMTYTVSDKDCPTGKHNRAFYVNNGLSHFYACQNSDSGCQQLSSDLWWGYDTSEINLSQNLNCGNDSIVLNRTEKTLNGNGHTITFDKPFYSDFISTNDSATLILKNIKIISKTTYPVMDDSADTEACGRSGGSRYRSVSNAAEKYIFVDSTIEAQGPVGEITTKGTCYLKRLSGGWPKKNLGFVRITEGATNVSGFESSTSTGTDVGIGENGTLNFKGKTANIQYTGNGIANICADEVNISCFCSDYTKATLNTSTRNVNICSPCQNKVTINLNANLCSSHIFSGSFWN